MPKKVDFMNFWSIHDLKDILINVETEDFKKLDTEDLTDLINSLHLIKSMAIHEKNNRRY
jgi:hypothetical protein